MSLEIKTAVVKPRRTAYGNISRRIGEGRTASRYEEATFDLQSEANFHYRPTWAPEFELYDQRRTAIRMKDWYAFKDPRQLYYGTYTISRNKLREVSDASFDFTKKHDLFESTGDDVKALATNVLLPIRHFEWGANMNNFEIARFGEGTAITQAASFCAMDRLGIAQVISRIGLSLNPDGKNLDGSKAIWLQNSEWQSLRHLVEDSFVLKDWFELFVVQNVVMDSLVFPLFYQHFDEAWRVKGGTALTMLTEFMRDWYKDHVRWVDATLKIAVAESEDNKTIISDWLGAWRERATSAIEPIAELGLGDGSSAAVEAINVQLDKRLKRAGL